MASSLSASPFSCLSFSNQTCTGEIKRIPSVDVASVSCSTISSLESHGNADALSAYQVKEPNCSPSTIGQFYSILQRCIQDNDTVKGEEIYSKILESEYNTHSFLGCHLIRMFTVFRDLEKANEVFYGLEEPNVYAWSAIIAAHASLGCSEHAIAMYSVMKSSGFEPDGHVFVAVLQACASLKSLSDGILIHDDIVEAGISSSVHVNNTLIDMYVKCGSFGDASVLFNKMPERDIVTWNAMIGGFSGTGDVQGAFYIFRSMSQEKFQPDPVSCICCLSACSNSAAGERGKELHAYIIAHGFDRDAQVVLALIDMYIACGYLDDVRAMFDKEEKDVMTIEFISSAYFLHGHYEEVIELLENVQREGIRCTAKTFINSLRACASLEDIDKGWVIHSNIVECGLELDKYICNTLVDFYGKCGKLDDAKAVFDRLQFQDVVSWSALISALVAHEDFMDGLDVFREMEENGIKPNEVTFTCALKACSGLAGIGDGLKHGRWIHNLVVGEGFEQNTIIGGSLVDMYTKCGDLEGASVVFLKLLDQDVVIWSAMISGYAQNGLGQEALQFFKEMQRMDIEPTPYTITAVLKACSAVSALGQGRQIHMHAVHKGLEFENIVGSALIDMYARCGSLEDACSVFDGLQSPDIVCWGTMITSFAQHNDYESAVRCFQDMEKHGHFPNAVIFTCLLTACCHANRVQEGCQHFRSIREHYGLLPTSEHYCSMVELLGHGCFFDEAEDLIESIPFESNIVGWISLLASCRRHGYLELGKRCFQHAVRISPGYSTEYRLMESLYDDAGLSDYADQIEELRISANAWKKPAKAFIEIDNNVHGFIVGDKTHPHNHDIYTKVDELSNKIKNVGDDLPKMEPAREKENTRNPMIHSEKLAIAFGLISTPEGSTIRVSKNLRVCSDCHSAAKAISKVERRDIIITDAYQIHHFHDGECSCVNSW
ncbi:hypothetical protein KP509_34G039000 [Ceratopteris richardii]|uniref:DYW domain-containing protein n=1 Tax=Ceratopteris richardii TaxID=49495 RepID=A0A8T2QJW5_CERRI|nr:hypothetical protein KP509_34G039000 [Ceratopteris richardii]